jgi:hypothetical protein
MRQLEIRAGWLCWDGEPLVELASTSQEMLIQEWLNSRREVTTVDFEHLATYRVIVKNNLGYSEEYIVGPCPEEHEHEPPLPDHHRVAQVAELKDIYQALNKADVEYEL